MMSAALVCLAQAIYYEARSEPLLGQYAVAEVILNRVDDPSFPNTVCAVVAEDRGPAAHDCQFSYMCDGKPEVMADSKARDIAVSVANITATRTTEIAKDAKYYHAAHIHPAWAKNLKVVAAIGNHIFYKEE